MILRTSVVLKLAILSDHESMAARLRPEWIDRLAVCGDLSGCVEQVRRLHEAGSESVVLLPLPDEPAEDGITAAGRIAAEIRRS